MRAIADAASVNDAGDANDGPAGGGPDANDASPPPLPACGVGIGHPYPNAVCSSSGSCACGDDPRPDCQSVATCAVPAGGGGRVWSIAAPPCTPPERTPCPASVAEARGQPCRPYQADCSYPDDLHCVCANDNEIFWSAAPNCGVPRTLWYCGFDDGAGPCPDGIPEVGAPCAGDLTCADQLQACHNKWGRVCVGGKWQVLGVTGECI